MNLYMVCLYTSVSKAAIVNTQLQSFTYWCCCKPLREKSRKLLSISHLTCQSPLCNLLMRKSAITYARTCKYPCLTISYNLICILNCTFECEIAGVLYQCSVGTFWLINKNKCFGFNSTGDKLYLQLVFR